MNRDRSLLNTLFKFKPSSKLYQFVSRREHVNKTLFTLGYYSRFQWMFSFPPKSGKQPDKGSNNPRHHWHHHREDCDHKVRHPQVPGDHQKDASKGIHECFRETEINPFGPKNKIILYYYYQSTEEILDSDTLPLWQFKILRIKCSLQN